MHCGKTETLQPEKMLTYYFFSSQGCTEKLAVGLDPLVKLKMNA